MPQISHYRGNGRTQLTRHGSSGVAAASVDRHNCGDVSGGSVCTTTTTTARWRWSAAVTTRPKTSKRGHNSRGPSLTRVQTGAGSRPRHDDRDIHGFAAEVALRAAVDGNLPPVCGRRRRRRCRYHQRSLACLANSPLFSSYFSLCRRRRSKSKASSAIFSRSIDQGWWLIVVESIIDNFSSLNLL